MLDTEAQAPSLRLLSSRSSASATSSYGSARGEAGASRKAWWRRAATRLGLTRSRSEAFEAIAARERAARERFARSSGESRPSRILLRDSRVPPASSGADSAEPRNKKNRYDHQSNGAWNIERVGGAWWKMYLDDWFNTVVHADAAPLMALLCAVYILVVFCFAVAYLSFADKCGMDFSDRIEASFFPRRPRGGSDGTSLSRKKW